MPSFPYKPKSSDLPKPPSMPKMPSLANTITANKLKIKIKVAAPKGNVQ